MIDGADVMVTLGDTASLQLIPPEKDKNSNRLSTDCSKSNCLFRAQRQKGMHSNCSTMLFVLVCSEKSGSRAKWFENKDK